MNKYYVAIDIGASSGRHMLGSLVDGKIQYEEIYRFDNGYIEKNGHKCWDIEGIFKHVINGLKRCGEYVGVSNLLDNPNRKGEIVSVGIDTWGVDFVLLDGNGNILGDSISYRDNRTEGMDDLVYQIIPEDKLYERTGIQKQIFNTIYQLMDVLVNHEEDMLKAKYFLMIPEYLSYRLSGVMANEYTNATTTQLVNVKTNEWDYELIEMLGYNKEMFMKLTKPGTKLGKIKKEIADKIGYELDVILPATHDTASAVAALPTQSNDTLYISSGTWSLMGIERESADCSEESRRFNFTNEGGVEYRYRYLKNIMGLWMIQSVRNEYSRRYSFASLCEMAKESTIDTIIDCNDNRFLSPANMMEAIVEYCIDKGLTEPKTPGDFARVIYRSLAKCYNDTVIELERMSNKTYDTINIIGGGSNATYLNELTGIATGKRIESGPSEATAIGNIILQMMADGVFKNLKEARKSVVKE